MNSSKFKRSKAYLQRVDADPRLKFIHKRADELNESLPASEIWFNKLYEEHKLSSDRFNWVVFGLIPDVYNKKLKYVIEIDGSIHTRSDVKIKDRNKNKVFAEHGIAVVRIKAFDDKDFKLKMTILHRIRTDDSYRKVYADWCLNTYLNSKDNYNPLLTK